VLDELVERVELLARQALLLEERGDDGPRILLTDLLLLVLLHLHVVELHTVGHTALLDSSRGGAWPTSTVLCRAPDVSEPMRIDAEAYRNWLAGGLDFS
jgi:hypothetical protein